MVAKLQYSVVLGYFLYLNYQEKERSKVMNQRKE
jgi:heme/copper-type cytochrome/quinol oxidase subunit 4